MVDIGYHEQIEGGVYGRANPATDSNPIARAQLQEASAQRQRERTTVSGYVPPSYVQQGTGALPTIGWTAQAPDRPVFPPYTPSGRIPDWNADGIPSAGGSYDMTIAVGGAFAPNRLNRAPIGGSTFDGWDGVPPNPNAPTTDVGGTIDLEW